MDIELLIAYGGFIITAAGFILQLYDKIPEKYLKKLYYFLWNKEFKVKMKSLKKYPSLTLNQINTDELVNTIKKEFKEKDRQFEGPQLRGKNYIELFLRDMQAPFFIAFKPSFSIDDHGKEIQEGIDTTIDLKGTIKFLYRDDLDNKKYLNIMEDIFEIMEETYHVKSNFVNYELISTLTDFKEDWKTIQTKEEENDTKIKIGNNILGIYSKKPYSLYDFYKKNVSSM